MSLGSSAWAAADHPRVAPYLSVSAYFAEEDLQTTRGPGAGSEVRMGDAKSYKMYVGGEWVDAAEGKTRKIVSPANGDVIAEVPEASAPDVDRAVAAAKKAYDETWSEATPGERSRALLRMADLVEEHGDELGRLESENVGKVLALTMSEEIPVIADQFRFFAAGARIGRASCRERVCLVV